jgi:hypothetical protein
MNYVCGEAEYGRPSSAVVVRKKRLNGHEKIGRAHRENRGVWLTPEDVDELWDDDAIRSAITQEWAD